MAARKGYRLTMTQGRALRIALNANGILVRYPPDTWSAPGAKDPQGMTNEWVRTATIERLFTLGLLEVIKERKVGRRRVPTACQLTEQGWRIAKGDDRYCQFCERYRSVTTQPTGRVVLNAHTLADGTWCKGGLTPAPVPDSHPLGGTVIDDEDRGGGGKGGTFR
ncbi:MAG TPA: hypothetical protein VEA38_20260 [Terriglobales bacterium]|nr:hypothetical protein [Terriglobales bacterium]